MTGKIARNFADASEALANGFEFALVTFHPQLVITRQIKDAPPPPESFYLVVNRGENAVSVRNSKSFRPACPDAFATNFQGSPNGASCFIAKPAGLTNVFELIRSTTKTTIDLRS